MHAWDVPVAIKFCGLTRADDAAHGVALGAAYLGVIFAGGPRLLDVRRAREVLAPADGTPVERVGVFGGQSPDEIARVADQVGLDTIQLHDDPTPERVRDVQRVSARPVWAVARVDGATVPPRIGSLFDCADGVLLDTLPRTAAAMGGTGRTFDWEGARAGVAALRAGRRLILAGGLTPDNVAAAIRALRPDVVDVSSGVEAAVGEKDHDRMAAFAATVYHNEHVNDEHD